MASAKPAVWTLSLIAICLVSLVWAEESSTNVNLVKPLSRKDFTAFMEKPTVTIIYFFKREYTLVNNFLREYEKSAAVIDIYDVELAKLNCVEESLDEPNEYCDKDGSEENLYAFRGGHELLALPLENTFDVNSIVSNILQIVLIRDVPILQTQNERNEYEQQNVGKRDIIFSFQTAIGTPEHRVFMEVAYAFRSRYTFGITTESPVISDLIGSNTGDNAIVWLLKCKHAKNGSPCQQSKYHDNIDLLSLVRYLRVLDIETIHDANRDGTVTEFEEFGLHEIFIFYHKESKDDMFSIAQSLKATFHGVVGILLVDTENPETRDLIFDEGATEVPRLLMRLRGVKQPFVMPSDFNPLAIEAFVSQVLDTTLREKSMMETPEAFGEEGFLPDEQDESTLAGVEKQDDQVAEAVSRLENIEIDRSFIPVLTDKTFTKETTGSTLKIVLFYLTFDAQSMAFLRSYADASFMLANDNVTVLAAIDCFDWTDVCGKNNISSYPTVRIYRKGREYTTYKGMLGATPIVNLVKKLMAESPVVLSNKEEHDQFVAGTYPLDLVHYSDVAVLGLFGSDDVKELASFKRVADMEDGSLVFAYSSAELTPSLSRHYHLKTPAIVVHKRQDSLDKMRILQKDLKTSAILKFVKEASLSVYPEITPVNFPAYYVQKKPFVLLFDENIQGGQGAHGEVAAVAASKAFPGFIFGWMELTRDDGVGGKVLLEYNSNAEPPSLFIVNHSEGSIYNYPSAEVNRNEVYKWVESVGRGERKPWKYLEKGEWKPLNPGYDFLAMIEEENVEEDVPVEQMSPPMRGKRNRSNILLPPGEEEERLIREELHSMQSELMDENEQEKVETSHHSEL